ncbi:MAG: hypothetical protein FWG53_09840 [Clostridiales bacterium]|nr:hypothetical protein [Clostridiales bacterium]
MKFHQASFTRVGGQGANDGWQTVNASQGATAGACSSFSRFQNGNVHEPDFDGEDMEQKTVTELLADGNYAFLTRIKYGLADQLGRPSMFASSFFVGINEFVRNPQGILRIKGENFRFDLESTKQAADEVLLADEVSPAEAAESIGLDYEKYLELARCVLYAQGAKTEASLHLICDCKEETVRNAMTCIYMAMPYAFRRKVSFSTYSVQRSVHKTIVFDRCMKNSDDLYFDLSTGENNVLTEAIAKRLKRYDFFDIAPKCLKGADAALQSQYFLVIDHVLARLGNQLSTSLDLTKLAYDTACFELTCDYLEKLNNEDLRRRLNELLSCGITQNALMDDQVNFALGEAVKRRIVLNDIVDEKLSRYLEEAAKGPLRDTASAYAAMKTMSENAAPDVPADEGKACNCTNAVGIAGDVGSAKGGQENGEKKASFLEILKKVEKQMKRAGNSLWALLRK